MPNQRALVNGCSEGGIGDALARSLHQKSVRVIATARNVSKVYESFAASDGVEVLQLDVNDQGSMNAAVQEGESNLDARKFCHQHTPTPSCSFQTHTRPLRLPYQQLRRGHEAMGQARGERKCQVEGWIALLAHQKGSRGHHERSLHHEFASWTLG